MQKIDAKTSELLKSWCPNATISLSDKGIVITGDVKIVKSMEIKQSGMLPIKIHKVIGNFNASNCFLRGLANFPDEIDGNLNLSSNSLESLINLPKVTGSIDISFNRGIRLEGCPLIINGDFFAMCCNLDSISDGPEIVNGDYDVSQNNIKVIPHRIKKVTGAFSAANNRITSTTYLPEIGGFQDFSENPVTADDTRSKMYVGND